MDPLTPGTLYAASAGGTGAGVFKSTDGGATWTRMNGGLTNRSVGALAIDPLTPATLYAGTGWGVFKSTDGGVSWTAMNSGLTNTYVSALAIDPLTPATVYAGTLSGGVFKSTDGGANWNAMNSGLPNSAVSVLAIDPLTPATVYAGTVDNGVFKSTDGGLSWTAMNSGLTDTYIQALAINPLTPATVYAGTSGFGGVFKSTDGGASWTVMNSWPTNSPVTALAINPLLPAILYAGTYGDGVFESRNGGASWTPISGLTNTFVHALAIDPSDPSAFSSLYSGTDGGVFKSTFAFATDRAVFVSFSAAIDNGLRATVVSTLAIDPLTPTTVYAGTFGGGVFKSTDGGASWTAMNSGLTDTYVQALAINPLLPATLYAGTFRNGVFKSTDGGVSWTAMNNGLTYRFVDALAIDPLTPATLYVGTSGGVFKSTDGGVSWTAMNNGLTNTYVLALAIDPLTPATVYAGTLSNGVFKSTDGGASWTAMNDGLKEPQVYGLAIDPLTPATLYVGSFLGVFKSTDGGASWTAVYRVPNAVALAIDPLTPATLYAGTFGYGVFKSTDRGVSWTAMNSGLTNTYVQALAIDPLTPTILYAGTYGGGVFDFESDTIPPSGTVVINGGAAVTTSTTAMLTLTCTDNVACTEMQVAVDGTADTEPFEPFAASKVVSLTSGHGTKTVAVRFKDAAGNISTQATATIVLESTDLAVTITGSADPVVAGSDITYTLRVTNNGPDDASGIEVSDTLLASTAFASILSCSSTGAGICGGSGNTWTVTFSSLAAGAVETMTLVAVVSHAVSDGMVLTNTASVSSSTLDPVAGNNSATTTTTVSAPLLSPTPMSLAFGPQLVNTSSAPQVMTISNTGSAPLLISNTVVIGANAADFQIMAGGNTCARALIPPGGACNVSIVFTPTPILAASRVAALTLFDNAPNAPHHIPLQGAVLIPRIALSPASLNFDVQTVCSSSAPKVLTVNNTGTGTLIIGDIALAGANPQAFHFSSAPRPISVAPGGSTTMTVVFMPLSTGPLAANLVLTDNSVNPSSPQTVALTGKGSGTADLGISMYATQVQRGGYLTYTSVVDDAGPLPACPVTFTNPIPTGTAFVQAFTTAGSCAPVVPATGGTLTCSLGTLPVGARAAVTMLVRVVAPAGSTIQNTGSVRAGTDDPNLANNSATIVTVVR